MTTIKKVFQPIIELLEANKDKRVSAVLNDILSLASVKQTRERASETFLVDATGAVVAIRDFYFKRWMPLVGKKAVEFAAKKGSKTGLSGLSTIGQSKFNAAKSRALKEEKELMDKIISGEIKVENAQAEREAIQSRRETPTPVLDAEGNDVTPGFATLEECVDYLKACRVKLTEKPVDTAKAA